MLPRLTAEESLVWSQRVAVGTGAMQKAAAMLVVSEWQRLAHGRPVYQTWQEQMEILREITAAMGGNVPPKASPTDS